MNKPADDPHARLERSWRSNAAAWTDAVREQRIASRRAGTDAAIVDAVLATKAKRVIDIGCGEGWLARALGARGCDVVGIDASPELIDAARAGGGRFETMRYAALADSADEIGRFDVAVFNFALLDDDVATPLRAARRVLADAGKLIIQTVHPWIACGDSRYGDGWRDETFATFGDAFREPMPWYFRTLSSWSAALTAGGFAIDRLHEPIEADSGAPLSLLIVAGAEDRTPGR